MIVQLHRLIVYSTTKHSAGGGGSIPIINIQFLFINGVCFRERITLRILLRSFLQCTTLELKPQFLQTKIFQPDLQKYFVHSIKKIFATWPRAPTLSPA